MNLWILTEERPKTEIIEIIIRQYLLDYSCSAFIDNLRILPVLEENKFVFTYKVIGCECNKISNIYIKIVSGYSSFVDYLVFYQKNKPNKRNIPIYAIEETKTDDKESRNTGVYQRASKFVFIQHYYPKTKKIMLYNLKVEQKVKPTDTYIFGTRLLLTLGIAILGKQLDSQVFKPFTSTRNIHK